MTRANNVQTPCVGRSSTFQCGGTVWNANTYSCFVTQIQRIKDKNNRNTQHAYSSVNKEEGYLNAGQWGNGACLIAMHTVNIFFRLVVVRCQDILSPPVEMYHYMDDRMNHTKQSRSHDDVIKWEHFPRYWPFVRGIHRPPVNFPHKG